MVGFQYLGYIQGPYGTLYQYRMVVRVEAPAGADLHGSITADGPGGKTGLLFVGQVQAGLNTYNFFPQDPSPTAGKQVESASFDLECSADTDYEDVASATTEIYQPGQPRPPVQPWTLGCPQQVVIDSRGSSKTRGMISPPGEAFANALRIASNPTPRFDADFVTQVIANPYPATGSIPAMLAAGAKLPFWYHTSVIKGKNWLRGELKQLEQHCPTTAVYLTGYSQGAQVAGDVYKEKTWEKVRGMVLFGDPYFNGKDGSNKGSFSFLRNGALGRRKAFNNAQVLSYCHAGDPVCQGKHFYITFGTAYHKNYAKLGEPEAAAQYFAGR